VTATAAARCVLFWRSIRRYAQPLFLCLPWRHIASACLCGNVACLFSKTPFAAVDVSAKIGQAFGLSAALYLRAFSPLLLLSLDQRLGRAKAAKLRIRLSFSRSYGVLA
jgi:hypothetical protein